MRFTVVTLFPEFFDSPLSCGLMSRAREKGIVDFSFVNPRDFAEDKHRTVDDRPYGGGPGMVMLAEPLDKALAQVREKNSPGRTLLLTPGGRPFDQALARDLAQEQTLTLVCGRYEGMDARLEELHDLEPVSLGDFVLNGGESAALNLIEAVARLRPGFMGHEESAGEESFSSGLLEYPHYTRPEEYKGLAVPEVLRSGDHGKVAAWRRQQSLLATLRRRPDLLEGADLDQKDLDFLHANRDVVKKAGLGRNLYLALLHYPVLNKQGKRLAVSLTNLDVHDIARVSRSGGLGGYYLVTPLDDQRALAKRLLDHWVTGPGQDGNPDRAEALSLVRAVPDLEEAVEHVAERTGQKPRLAATSARLIKGAKPLSLPRLRGWLAESPVLLLLGTGSGLDPRVVRKADGCLRPLRYMSDYNHYSVRAAAAMIVDRILGDFR